MALTSKPNYIGLIPAAGHAARLKNLSCSKEIFSLRTNNKNGQLVSFPVSTCLIDAYGKADIKRIYIIIRKGKEDICEILGNGKEHGVDLNYLYSQIPYGLAYTIDQAYSIYSDQYVALGFPDILFKPYVAYSKLIEKQQQTNADVVLGLFKAKNPQKMDMVELNNLGEIQSIQIKPQHSNLIWTWIIAVWNPTFSKFMHQELNAMLSEFKNKNLNDCHVGIMFQLALRAGIEFEHVFFEKGELIDIGTPEDLIHAKQAMINDDWSELV